MAKNQTYKAFSAPPSHVMDLNGVLLDKATILSQIVAEVQGISTYATYVVRNDTELGTRLALAGAVQPAEAGRRAGVNMPDFLATGRTGKSRKERLFRHRVVTEYRSWDERVKAANGESGKHVSQGWKRTVDASPPSYGEDYVNLGSVDRSYALIDGSKKELSHSYSIDGVPYNISFIILLVDNDRARIKKLMKSNTWKLPATFNPDESGSIFF